MWVTAVSLGKSNKEWHLNTPNCKVIGDFECVSPKEGVRGFDLQVFTGEKKV